MGTKPTAKETSLTPPSPINQLFTESLRAMTKQFRLRRVSSIAFITQAILTLWLLCSAKQLSSILFVSEILAISAIAYLAVWIAAWKDYQLQQRDSSRILNVLAQISEHPNVPYGLLISYGRYACRGIFGYAIAICSIAGTSLIVVCSVDCPFWSLAISWTLAAASLTLCLIIGTCLYGQTRTLRTSLNDLASTAKG